MATSVIRESSPTLRRKRALSEWLDRLDRECRAAAAAANDRSLVLEVDDETLTVESWAVSRIAGSVADEPEARGELLAQAVALRMKVAADRSRLNRVAASGGQALYAVQAELMLDMATALALLRELQPVVEDEVRRGRMDLAKRWTSLKNQLSGTTWEVRTLLADSERMRAESWIDKLTEQPGATHMTADRYAATMKRLAEEDRQRKLQERARRRARQALANLPSRTELLTAALAVTTALWLGFVRLPERFATPPRILTLEDLPRPDGILGVRSRPPSLYVTVDGAMWEALDREARRHRVRTISSVLLTNGYRGVLLRTAEGRPVAQWLSMHGVQLLETPEIPVARPEAMPIRSLAP